MYFQWIKYMLLLCALLPLKIMAQARDTVNVEPGADGANGAAATGWWWFWIVMLLIVVGVAIWWATRAGSPPARPRGGAGGSQI